MAQSKKGSTKKKSTKPKTTRSKANNSTKSKAKKKTTTTKIKKEQKVLNENTSRIYEEVAAILLLAFGVFFIIAMHTHLAGSFGIAISSVIKGLFGLSGFIFPYLMVVYSIMIFAHMNRPLKGRKLIYILIMFLMIVLINSDRFLEDFYLQTSGGVDAVYRSGIMLDNGGVVGMYIGYFIHKAVGSVGLYIMAISIIIICLILTVNTPISKAYDNAKKKQEELAKIRAEKRAMKAEQIASERYNTNYLSDDIQEENYYDKRDTFKSKARKNTIVDLMKNDENYGLTKDELPSTDIFDEPVELIKENKIKPKKNTQPIEIVDDNIQFGITEDGFVSKDKKIIEKTKQENEKIEDMFVKHSSEESANYTLPPINLLNPPKNEKVVQGRDKALMENAMLLENTLKSFHVDAKVVNVTKGSSVTRYEIQPAIGVKVASIVRLTDDIALSLRAKSIRIEAPIPGKAAVGIEVENESREMVTISEMINSPEFKQHPSKLAFVVGKDISGKPIVADLAKMPHLLIAGATGSGKSVCINSIITSILYRAKPDEVKLLLIDPKMVELGNYNGIPHLLIPVVTDCTKASAALQWAVAEMSDRYKKFKAVGVREMKGYNALMKKEGKDEEVLPQIVIIIDELADLMMVAKSQVEEAIVRLSQLARAAGMHLIVATQRPSVNVVTGLIKANVPSRIAFMVSSQIDSRTIIDMQGAEKLVGNGDMLYKPQDLDKPLRIQGPFISDEEIHNLIDYIKSQVEETTYNEEVVSRIEKGDISPNGNSGNDEDELMEDAIQTVVKAGQASVSMLQRRFRIGYNRAARIIEDMESRGIIGPPDGSRPRAVLISEEDLLLGENDEEKE